METPLSAAQAKRVRKLLGKGVLGHWKAGEAIGRAIGPRAMRQRGGSDSLLERCAAAVGVGANNLSSARRFAFDWTKAEARQAERKGIPWHFIIALLPLGSLAGRLALTRSRATQGAADEIRQERRKLVRAFNPERPEKWLRRVRKTIRRFQQQHARLRSHRQCWYRVRRVRSSFGQLKAALAGVTPFAAGDEPSQWKTIIKKLRRLHHRAERQMTAILEGLPRVRPKATRRR